MGFNELQISPTRRNVSSEAVCSFIYCSVNLSAFEFSLADSGKKNSVRVTSPAFYLRLVFYLCCRRSRRFDSSSLRNFYSFWICSEVSAEDDEALNFDRPKLHKPSTLQDSFWFEGKIFWKIWAEKLLNNIFKLSKKRFHIKTVI